mmetsp:Transcript_26873/g.39763  ORF Transcript_26873/g.39763 Transcript_26873/m.39763 type:complete len:228 (+) Transcript_26873:66-749(+)|eukprot:CAMPEP_0194199640 /NCGR_PEP_ID=MMETSP0156-20130528/589_1 /TAXON_ID=33649 /ORGANISM="Thalassionema nitzschioides, Strain L26-B" /LENGTH=227 /DNA_ID=CAMNT_0038924569 /DNA_START=66 /DNA_END=749 /DNA_ORIENTATION=+
MTKIVIVCTSESDLSGHKTGLWLEELAAPCLFFKEKGYEVIVSSPKGGEIPIDSGSLQGDFFTEACKTFMGNDEAKGEIKSSVPLKDIDFSTVDAIFLAGGHGTCVDFHTDPTLKGAIEDLYSTDKIVGAVCHGLLGLVSCVKKDGTALVSGKTVTGFSDSEEEAVQLTNIVPFLTESKLKELGGNYEKADNWSSKVCVDKNLVTGQNPQSSEATAIEVAKLLELKG